MQIFYSLYDDDVTSDSYVNLYLSGGHGSCYNRMVLEEQGRVAQHVTVHFTSDAADLLTLDGVGVSFTGCSSNSSWYAAWETAINSGTISRVRHYRYNNNDYLVEARVLRHQHDYYRCKYQTSIFGESIRRYKYKTV